ncbi:MAG TPA: HAD family hydrolase [Chloroflexota bacterium]|nr:HAD family hydrolase [Chloroflexota bacterium]
MGASHAPVTGPGHRHDIPVDEEVGGEGWYRLWVNGSPARFPRAFFFDLDGTLLAPGARLTRRTVEAVRAAAECGAAIVLATGGFSARTHLLASILHRHLSGGVWSVTHNGGAIWDPEGRLVHHCPTPRGAVAAALAMAGPRIWVTYETVDRAGCTAVYYAGRMRHQLAPLLWGPQAGEGESGLPLEADSQQRDIAVGLEPRWDWRRARSPQSYEDGRILGAWCVGSPQALATLDAQARDGSLYGARYLPWSSRLGQILNRPRLRLVGRDIGAAQATKGNAAAWLCDHLGLDPADTAAFGDGDNDLELLAFAGTAVAMANATPRARAAATLMAPANSEEGVARVIYRWLDGLVTAPAGADTAPGAD